MKMLAGRGRNAIIHVNVHKMWKYVILIENCW